MLRERRRRSLPVGLALVAAVVIAACGDDPTDIEDHSDPEGVVLELNGATIAEYDGDTQSWTGEMEVGVGMETAHISVIFVDHDGDDINPDPAEFYLEVAVDDGNIAEFEQDTPGEFGGHLHGNQVGTTEVTFRLMHGAVGAGHPDFETVNPVNAHVN